MNFLIYGFSITRDVDEMNLLSCEMQKRGYTAEVLTLLGGKNWLYDRFCKTDVIVTRILYQSRFVSQFIGKRYPLLKIVDLHNEPPSPTINEENLEYNYAKYARHCCMNENMQQYFSEYGFPIERLKVTGYLSTQLCDESFHSIYRSKIEFAKDYGLPENKKWILYVASASLNNKTEIENYKQMAESSPENYESLMNLYTILKRTYEFEPEYMKWVDKLLENDDLVFIYRPHHSSVLADSVMDMVKVNDNFHIIKEGCLSEWIINSDYVNFYTTSAVLFAYAANKHFATLRPLGIHGGQNDFYKNVNTITNYDDYKIYHRQNHTHDEFLIPEEALKEYFPYGRNDLTYKRICDFLEEAYRDKSVDAHYDNLILEHPDPNIRYPMYRLRDFYGELLLRGNLNLANVFIRVFCMNSAFMSKAFTLLDGGVSNIHDLEKCVYEKGEKLSKILGCEVRRFPYFKAELTKHRNENPTNGDINFDEFDSVENRIRNLINSEKSELEQASEYYEIITELLLLPSIREAMSREKMNFLCGYVNGLAHETLALINCESYLPYEKILKNVNEYLEPITKAQMIIVYSAGRMTRHTILSALINLEIIICEIWDIKADEIEEINGIPVVKPFNTEPNDDLLIINNLNDLDLFNSVNEELRDRGYKVMDGINLWNCAAMKNDAEYQLRS